jgi:C-terminal processing protease CtpA/Prc
VVTFVIPRSPADAAGLRPGDHILAVNSRLATQLAVSDISLMSSGPVGSRLDLLVTSKENGPTQLRSVRLAEMLP